MKMKNLIKVFCLSSVFLGTPVMAKSHIYALQGFLIPGEQPEWNSLLAALQDSIEKKKNEEIVLKSSHNSDWKDICQEIKELPVENKNDKIILVGHSYGASTAVEIAKCVGPNIKIDLMVTIDSVKKISYKNSNIIPENVEKNINIYQTQDFILKGERDNHRANGSYKKIENIEMKVNMLTLTPHNMLLQELVNRKSMSKILNTELNFRSNPDDSLAPSNEHAPQNTKSSETGSVR